MLMDIIQYLFLSVIPAVQTFSWALLVSFPPLSMPFGMTLSLQLRPISAELNFNTGMIS